MLPADLRQAESQALLALHSALASGEKGRWTETVAALNVAYENLVGDSLVDSSTEQVRASLVASGLEPMISAIGISS
jgi:hypothetical protein